MQMAGGYTPATNPNKRLYNGGSEWQDDIDGLADYYSTFFREYDAVIGRFNGVDPMASAEVSISVYAYSGNNSINFNDPNGDYKAGDNRMPEWYGPRMRDIVEKAMSSYGMGSDWYGSGGGSYGDFKARFDYLGSTGWQKEQNAVGRSEFFSTLLSVAGDGFAPEGTYWWDKEKGGQLDPEFRVLVHGNIVNGDWVTSRVEYGEQQNLEGTVRTLIAQGKTTEAVNEIIKGYPREMRKNAPSHIWAVDEAQLGGHLTAVGRNGSLTTYSGPVLRYLKYNLVSFGYEVRLIYAERLHMFQFQEDKITSGYEREVLSYFAFFQNPNLPNLDFSCPKERKSIDEIKASAAYNFSKIKPDRKSIYAGMNAFIQKQ